MKVDASAKKSTGELSSYVRSITPRLNDQTSLNFPPPSSSSDVDPAAESPSDAATSEIVWLVLIWKSSSPAGTLFVNDRHTRYYFVVAESDTNEVIIRSRIVDGHLLSDVLSLVV